MHGFEQPYSADPISRRGLPRRESFEPVSEDDGPRSSRSRARQGSSVWIWVLVLGGVGFGFLLLVGGGLLLLLLIGGNRHGKKIPLRNGSELYYTSTVTEAQARKLADHMNADEKFFGSKDTKGTFQVNRTGDIYELRMVVKEGADQNDTLVMVCQLLSLQLSSEVFDGAFVDIHLCDQELKTLRVIRHPGR
jgi:hypothetical protein